MPRLDDISIRTALQPGDIGMVAHLHGKLYWEEYNYGIEFENYVAEGLVEFYRQHNRLKERVWICEKDGKMVGFLLLKQRGDTAQLRYFIITPEYRGIGLGKKLMQLYMDFMQAAGYSSSYLWTTHELNTAASLYCHYGFQLAEEKESNAFGKPLREQKYELTTR